MAKYYSTILSEVNEIKNANSEGYNTAERVGTVLKDILDFANNRAEVINIDELVTARGSFLFRGQSFYYKNILGHTRFIVDDLGELYGLSGKYNGIFFLISGAHVTSAIGGQNYEVFLYNTSTGYFDYSHSYHAYDVPDCILRAFGEELASSTMDGLMSKNDKSKIDGIGSIGNLTTTQKGSLVAAINELNETVKRHDSSIGDLVSSSPVGVVAVNINLDDHAKEGAYFMYEGNTFTYKGHPAHCRVIFDTDSLLSDIVGGATNTDRKALAFCTNHYSDGVAGEEYILFEYNSEIDVYKYRASYYYDSVPEPLKRAFGEAYATSTQDGIMSAADKQRLDEMQSSYASSKEGSVFNVSASSDNVNLALENIPIVNPDDLSVNIPSATTSKAGIMSAEDKKLLSTLYNENRQLRVEINALKTNMETLLTLVNIQGVSSSSTKHEFEVWANEACTERPIADGTHSYDTLYLQVNRNITSSDLDSNGVFSRASSENYCGAFLIAQDDMYAWLFTNSYNEQDVTASGGWTWDELTANELPIASGTVFELGKNGSGLLEAKYAGKFSFGNVVS